MYLSSLGTCICMEKLDRIANLYTVFISNYTFRKSPFIALFEFSIKSICITVFRSRNFPANPILHYICMKCFFGLSCMFDCIFVVMYLRIYIPIYFCCLYPCIYLCIFIFRLYYIKKYVIQVILVVRTGRANTAPFTVL